MHIEGNDALRQELSVARHEAAAARDELRRFFMQVPDPVALFSGPDHVVTLVNSAYLKLAGRDPLGQSLREAFTEEEAGEFFDLLDQVFRTGQPLIGREMLFRRAAADGTSDHVWVDVRFYPTLDEHNAPAGIVAFVHDVTNRVLARRIIEDNEGRVQRYAEAMPQMAFMTDAQGEVTYFNSQHYEYFGVDRTEREGSRWKTQNIVHPDDLQMSIDAWAESVRTGNTYQVQYRLRRHDGMYRWHLARAIPDRDPEGNIRAWYGTNTDVHDQKLVERRLAEEQQLREHFTNTLAHDLRTPLSAAMMGVQVLILDPDNAERRGPMLHTITKSLARVDEMIMSLLDANRLHAGQPMSLVASECDFYEVAQTTLQDLALIHGDRIAFRGQRDVHGYWSIDGVRRVIENLVTNAFKYGSPDAPVTVTLARSQGKACLSVHNYGRHLSEIEMSSLFELFQRSRDAVAGHTPGWGIGLSVVKGIVEAQGGTITVDSAPHSGTSFTVELPLDVRLYLASR
jgi:PAS domain S-box-containing protein